MGLRSTRAVVSHTIRMSNSSRIVSLVTEKYGLVKVMAKGARRPKSKFGASFETVSLIDSIYYHRDTREIQTISSAEIIESYKGLKSDIRLFSTASCMVEIAESYTAPEDPFAGIFALLVESLDGLKKCSGADAKKHLWMFLLKFLAVSGYKPSLENCMICGKRPKGKSVFLSYSDGAIICSCTDPGERFGSQVSPGSLRIMNDLASARVEDLVRLKLTGAQNSEVEKIIFQFLSYHSGSSRQPRSLAFLRKIDAGRQRKT